MNLLATLARPSEPAASCAASAPCCARNCCSCGATASRSPRWFRSRSCSSSLFGYAINTMPRNLPTAVLLQELSDVGRSILAAHPATPNSSRSRGNCATRPSSTRRSSLRPVLFAVEIPANFERALRRGDDAGVVRRRRRHRPGGDRAGDRCALADRHHGARQRSRACPKRPAAVRDPHARALQPGRLDAAQHRAWPSRHYPHPDHADLHRACRSPARPSAAPWRACWRCRSRRSRSCSARSRPMCWSASCRRRLFWRPVSRCLACRSSAASRFLPR